MFSGIVETMAQVVKIETEQTNKHFTLRNPFGEPLSIDQSIAHNGVCLTVVRIEGDLYTVTAMQETLRLTNLDLLKVGDFVNVERSMLMGGRLDGHIVQGHVDQKAVCIDAHETDGSWYYRFEYDSTKEMVERGYFCVDKGSVTINGASPTSKATKDTCRFASFPIPRRIRTSSTSRQARSSTSSSTSSANIWRDISHK